MSSLYFLLLFLFLLPLTSAETCRALVLEGGGDKGAYQAGALAKMFELIPNEIKYDVISGVSVGALNAAALAQFAIGDEGNMTNFLLDIWKNIQASDIYTDWTGGIIDGLIFRPSLYDTTPLYNFLKDHFTRPVQRKLSIGACNANNGSFVRFNEDLSKEDLIIAVRASSAMPMIFPYVNFMGDTYIDGGSVQNLDVAGAVERCREITDNMADIIVDVILCTGSHLPDVDQSQDKTLQMLSRYLQINSYQSALDDLLHAKVDFPNLNFRYVIIPTVKLPSGEIPLGFDKAQLQEMIDIGMQDAEDRIKAGVTDFKDIQEKLDLIRAKKMKGNTK